MPSPPPPPLISTMYCLMKLQSIKDIALLGRFVHHCSGWVISREGEV